MPTGSLAVLSTIPNNITRCQLKLLYGRDYKANYNAENNTQYNATFMTKIYYRE